MALRVCWFCDARSHQTLHGEPWRREDGTGRGATVWMAAFRCDECQVLSVAGMEFDRDPQSPVMAKEAMDARAAVLEWLPVTALRRRYPDVPDHIADAASEAHACHSIRSYRAAALMARSVIEATAKHKGITKGVLRDKIDQMRQKDLIGETVRHQAHEIRHLGNDMAHGDFVEPVSEEASAEILELMAKVLAGVYQDPAQLARLREARLAKEAEAADPGDAPE